MNLTQGRLLQWQGARQVSFLRQIYDSPLVNTCNLVVFIILKVITELKYKKIPVLKHLELALKFTFQIHYQNYSDASSIIPEYISKSFHTKIPFTHESSAHILDVQSVSKVDPQASTA